MTTFETKFDSIHSLFLHQKIVLTIKKYIDICTV
jgi:hypothetical protein